MLAMSVGTQHGLQLRNSILESGNLLVGKAVEINLMTSLLQLVALSCASWTFALIPTPRAILQLNHNTSQHFTMVQISSPLYEIRSIQFNYSTRLKSAVLDVSLLPACRR